MGSACRERKTVIVALETGRTPRPSPLNLG